MKQLDGLQCSCMRKTSAGMNSRVKVTFSVSLQPQWPVSSQMTALRWIRQTNSPQTLCSLLRELTMLDLPQGGEVQTRWLRGQSPQQPRLWSLSWQCYGSGDISNSGSEFCKGSENMQDGICQKHGPQCEDPGEVRWVWHHLGCQFSQVEQFLMTLLSCKL